MRRLTVVCLVTVLALDGSPALAQDVESLE